MAFSKIIFNGSTLMDVTGDTVTASTLISGNTAHDASGTQITGTASGGSVTVEPLSVTTNGTYTAPTGKAYSPVTVSVSGGSGNWMGNNPTKIQTFTPQFVYLSNTTFSSWTYTTSYTVLEASSYYSSMTLDDDHDYIQIFRFHSHMDYGNWTPVKAITDWCATGVCFAYRRGYSLTDLKSETRNQLTYLMLTPSYAGYYYNSSGVENYTVASSYGVCITGMNAPTITDATSSTPIVEWRHPQVIVQGNNNVYSQLAFNSTVAASSYYESTCEIWQVDAGTSLPGFTSGNAVHILNNGL